MGQGQGKASKRRETNGESSPSPQKEAKKSPKRSSRSPSQELPPSGQAQGRPPSSRESKSPSKERQSTSRDSPDRARQPVEKEVRETLIDDVVKPLESKRIESPPKPKRTYDVEFIEQDDKENVPSTDDSFKSSPKTPVKMSVDDTEPFTPVRLNDFRNHVQATSTPAQNGTGEDPRHLEVPYSDDEQDHTDQSDDEAFSSEQQRRSNSPSASCVSFSTINSSIRIRSDSTYDRKIDVNYGKFLNTSYLKHQNYLKRTGVAPDAKPEKGAQFIRPANFSYAKEPPSFLQGKKSGMMQLASGTKVVTKARRSSSPAKIRNMEAVRFSMFPGGKPPAPREIAKIEREDWPGPPSPAAILPEIMRQRRKSRGERDDDEEEEEVYEDPKIKREIEELSKFKDESGIGKIMYKELEEMKIMPSKPLDPWKASRVPNADHEPKYQTRYQSPMFASPSRFIDYSRRRAWDDNDIRGYRTMATMANFPVPKPGYGLSPRSATLPVSGMYGGPLNYQTYFDLEMADGHEARQSTRTSTSSINTEASSKVASTIFDQPGVSLMTFQKSSWHTEAQPPTHQYDRLKISNFDLPRDVDRNQLEIHLNKDEFESIFNMTQEDFRHLPEWKQNDLKRRVDLY